MESDRSWGTENKGPEMVTQIIDKEITRNILITWNNVRKASALLQLYIKVLGIFHLNWTIKINSNLPVTQCAVIKNVLEIVVLFKVPALLTFWIPYRSGQCSSVLPYVMKASNARNHSQLIVSSAFKSILSIVPAIACSLFPLVFLRKLCASTISKYNCCIYLVTFLWKENK